MSALPQPWPQRPGRYRHIGFVALAVLAPTFVALMPATYFWNEAISQCCVAVGLLMALALFVWSLVRIRRYPFRVCFIGFASCAVVFLMLICIAIILPGGIEARKRILENVEKYTENTFRYELAGTWSMMGLPLNVAMLSASDPVLFTCTFSPDGSFSEHLGHRSAPVTYQGTWQIQGRELVLTFTNATGTGSHRPLLSEVGKVDRWQIIRLDEHQLVYTVDGSTNSFTR